MHREKKESTRRVEDGKGMKELCPLFPEPASPRRENVLRKLKFSYWLGALREKWREGLCVKMMSLSSNGGSQIQRALRGSSSLESFTLSVCLLYGLQILDAILQGMQSRQALNG